MSNSVSSKAQYSEWPTSISSLISEAKACIQEANLGTIGIGIDEIQKGYEEIAREISQIESDPNDRALITLVGKVNSLVNYRLDSLINIDDRPALSNLSKLYGRLRELFQNELSTLSQKFASSQNSLSNSTMARLPLSSVENNNNAPAAHTESAAQPSAHLWEPGRASILFEQSLPIHPEEIALPQNAVPNPYLESRQFLKDREEALAAVKQNGLALQYASEELRGDREVVLAAVTQNGEALKFAGQELKRDMEVVLSAVIQNGLALKYAIEELRGDREFILAAVTQNGLALKYASEELKRDREIVFAAVTEFAPTLQFASEEFRRDKEIVLSAVTQNGLALEFACEELKKDRKVVLVAVNQEGLSLQFADRDLKKDSDLILAAVKQNGLALQFATEEYKANPKLVLAAVKRNGLALQFASTQLRHERELVLEAVRENGLALQYASVQLKSDREIVLNAVKQNRLALAHAASKLRVDEDILLEIVLRGSSQAGVALTANDPDVINRMTILQEEVEREAERITSRIAAIDEVMRKAIASIGELFDRQLKIINGLLAQEPDERNFQSITDRWEDQIREFRQEQLGDYCSLIEQRATIVEDGIEVQLTKEKKEELKKNWLSTINGIIDEVGPLEIDGQTNLEALKSHIEKQRAEKFESYNQMMDSKTSLTNRLFLLQYETHQLFKIKQKWLQSQANDIWSSSATGNIGVLTQCIGKFWPWNKKAGINQLNVKGVAPIHLAVLHDQSAVLDLLLSSGADACLPDGNRNQPLHMAAKMGLIPIALKLLNCGAKINALGAEDRCPLHIAVFNGREEDKLDRQIEMTEFLLDRGASINAKVGINDGGKTALHDAVYFGLTKMVLCLVKRPELDVMICDRNGLSPLYYAVMMGRLDIASLIVGHSSWRPIQDPQDPNHRDNLLKLRIQENGEEMRKFLRTLAI